MRLLRPHQLDATTAADNQGLIKDPSTGLFVPTDLVLGLTSSDSSVTINDNGDGTLDLAATGTSALGTWNIPAFVSGQYYGNPWSTGGGTKSVNAGTMELAPFPVPVSCTIDQLAADVTVTGAGVVRLGIYSSTSGHLPGSLLLDAGTVTAASTGLRTKSISQTLPPGLYWLACLVDTSGGTWRTWGGIATGVLGVNNLGVANTRMFATGVTTGALPSTPPALTLDNSISIFRILARAA